MAAQSMRVNMGGAKHAGANLGGMKHAGANPGGMKHLWAKDVGAKPGVAHRVDFSRNERLCAWTDVVQ